MGFYDGLAATSLALLTKYGRNVTRRRFAEGAYDPATGSVTQTPTDSTFRGALLGFTVREVRGALVTERDKRLLLEAAGSPTNADVFVIDGIEYAVVSFDAINPAGIPVIYDLHLRG